AASSGKGIRPPRKSRRFAARSVPFSVRAGRTSHARCEGTGLFRCDLIRFPRTPHAEAPQGNGMRSQRGCLTQQWSSVVRAETKRPAVKRACIFLLLLTCSSCVLRLV